MLFFAARRAASTAPHRLLAVASLPVSSRCFCAAPAPPKLSAGITVEEARALPVEYYAFTNESLVTMAATGDHDAKMEVLIRNIMAVDRVSWDDAQPRMKQIEVKAMEGIGLTFMPHKIGVVCSGTNLFKSF